MGVHGGKIILYTLGEIDEMLVEARCGICCNRAVYVLEFRVERYGFRTCLVRRLGQFALLST